MEVFPLRPSAYLCVLCVNRPFNAEGRRDTQRPQRNKSDFATFCAKPLQPLFVRIIADFYKNSYLSAFTDLYKNPKFTMSFSCPRSRFPLFSEDYWHVRFFGSLACLLPLQTDGLDPTRENTSLDSLKYK